MDFDAVLQESIVKICGLPADEVRPETRLDELGVDSLAVAEIIVELEMRLDCEFPVGVLRQLDQVQTVGDVARELGVVLHDAAPDPGR